MRWGSVGQGGNSRGAKRGAVRRGGTRRVASVKRSALVGTVDNCVTNFLENWVLELSRCHGKAIKNRTDLSPFLLAKL